MFIVPPSWGFLHQGRPYHKPQAPFSHSHFISVVTWEPGKAHFSLVVPKEAFVYYPSSWQWAFPIDVHIFCSYFYACFRLVCEHFTASTAAHMHLHSKRWRCWRLSYILWMTWGWKTSAIWIIMLLSSQLFIYSFIFKPIIHFNPIFIYLFNRFFLCVYVYL